MLITQGDRVTTTDPRPDPLWATSERPPGALTGSATGEASRSAIPLRTVRRSAPAAAEAGWLAHRVGEQVDLVKAGRGGHEDQLVAARFAERGGIARDHLLAHRGARRDLPRHVAEPAIVVVQVRVRVLARAVAEAEVGEAQLARPSLP